MESQLHLDLRLEHRLDRVPLLVLDWWDQMSALIFPSSQHYETVIFQTSPELLTAIDLLHLSEFVFSI